jgi:hypothetical protein
MILECGPHTDEECEAMSRELESLGVPDVLKGTDFACSCPFGVHGGWGIVDAPDEEAAVAGFGPVNRAHLKAHLVEIVKF